MFGWALFKLRKRYKKKCNIDDTNVITLEKRMILDDMCVKLIDVIQNENYIRLYYPMDERLKNKGDLTLIDPSYCPHFSGLLQQLKDIFKGIKDTDAVDIPDQQLVCDRALVMLREDSNCNATSIFALAKERVKCHSLTKDDILSLLMELMRKIINATIGDKVRKYRTNKLLRVNTVAFRTELAVKSEKK